MSKQVIVDTGPLVAILCRDDQHHRACQVVAKQIAPPLITTWLVVTEAAWLLRRVSGGVERLVELLDSGLVRCHDLEPAFIPWFKAFLSRYADLQPQIADASVVFTADRYDTDLIFTLDRRDFLVIRNKHGDALRLLPGVL